MNSSMLAASSRKNAATLRSSRKVVPPSSCATTRSTRLRGLAVVELEQAAESLTTFQRAGRDLRRLRRDEFVPETLVRPFFMIVTHKFVDGCPEMPFAEQHHPIQALGLG